MISAQTGEETLFVEPYARPDADGALVTVQLVIERCPDCGQVTQFEFTQADLLAAAPAPITREYACHRDNGTRRRQLVVSNPPNAQSVEVVQFVARRRM